MAGFLPDLKQMYAKQFGLPGGDAPKLVPQLGVDFVMKAAELARKIQEAQKLKDQGSSRREAGNMVSGHYVPDYGGMIAGLGASIIGSRREKKLAEEQAALAAQQSAEQARLLGEMPTGQEALPAREAMGPPQMLPTETASGDITMQPEQMPMLPPQAAKPPTQQEIMGWAAQMSKVNPNLANLVSGKVVEGNLAKMFAGPKDKYQVVGGRLFNTQTEQFEDMPESEADRQKRIENREIKMAEIEQRAEAARLRSEDVRLSIEQREAAARESLQLRRDLAGMNASLRRELAGGGGGGKQTPKEQAEVRARDRQMQNLDETLKLLEDPETEGAFGMKMGTADTIGGPVQSKARSNLTDKQSAARSMVANITGATIKERYGAALTKTEDARANSYLPSPYDDRKETIRKVKGMRDFIAEMDDKYLGGTGPRATGAAPAAAPKSPAPSGASGSWKIVP